MSPAEISVERKAVPWRDRAANYLVFLDDQEVGSVRQGKTWKGSCASGEHSLSMRVNMYGNKGWLSSKTLLFELESGQIGQFECRPRRGKWRFMLPEVDMTVGRDQYITLEQLH